MPQINVKIHVITQTFEDGNKSCLSEALFFPEVTCLDDELDDVQNVVTENVLSLLAHVPNSDLSNRLQGVSPELFRVQLDVDPAERSRCWKESVTLELQAIKWQQSSDATVVYIPSLGIEILANKAADLP